MIRAKSYNLLGDSLQSLLRNPSLRAIRNGITLTLPLVMSGCVAVLLANFPVAGYQNFMQGLFGENWRNFSVHIADGTFSILAIVMLLTISFSLAENQNRLSTSRDVHPFIVALVSLACLITLLEPYNLVELNGDHPPPGLGLPMFWLGIHGLFLSIIVAFVSNYLFFRLKRIPWLNISFHSEEANPDISWAFAAMLPGMLTIIIFATVKYCTEMFGIESLNQYFFNLISLPFEKLGNTFPTALFYTFVRHLFWFFGIHGSNLLEPVTTAIYVPAMQENIDAIANGLPPPQIFTKTFFDAFMSMGGSGATLSLLLCLLWYSRRGSMHGVAKLSLLPAIFNINELVMFGLPIILNPIFLIPFLLAPLAMCITTFAAMSLKLVPYTIQAIDWTAPPLIGGYAATGSYAGAIMQVVNLAVGIMIYLPFVRMAERIKQESFNNAFRELMPGNVASIGNPDYTLSREARALSASLTRDLAQAIKRGELSLEYQPQVESRDGSVFGVEALMRWDHKRLGRIPPGLFIALAEEGNLIKQLGVWALEESCRQWSEWRDAGAQTLVMSVNLSANQLDDDRIYHEIRERIERYNIPAGRLEVEVTESVAIGGDLHHDLLHRIHALGVSLAIDDFGMGHSSLIYLKQFPVDTLKIDRILSKDAATNRFSSEIILTVAELCKSLGIHCLVEYVDNVEQLRALQALGCTRIQGWLYSPSLPPGKCLAFIKKGAPVYTERVLEL